VVLARSREVHCSCQGQELVHRAGGRHWLALHNQDRPHQSVSSWYSHLCHHPQAETAAPVYLGWPAPLGQMALAEPRWPGWHSSTHTALPISFCIPRG
jgi:hypothetical protein